MLRLSRQAAQDLLDIADSLIDAERHGQLVPGSANKVADRLHRKMIAIAERRVPGHRRYDIPGELPWLAANEGVWVIFFHRDTREIARIVNGRRDFPHLFGGSA